MVDFLWWYYPLGILAFILVGGFIATVGFQIFAYFQSRSLKKSLGLNKLSRKQVSELINKDKELELNKQVFLNPGDVNLLDAKEDEENERNKAREYREFDKLRRDTQNESITKAKTGPAGTPRILKGQEFIPIESSESVESDYSGDEPD